MSARGRGPASAALKRVRNASAEHQHGYHAGHETVARSDRIHYLRRQSFLMPALRPRYRIRAVCSLGNHY